MKKIILSLAISGVALSPLAIFAANQVAVPAQGTPVTTTAPLTGQAPSGQKGQAPIVTTNAKVTPAEKVLAKKLVTIKKKNKDTNKKIATNITQVKTKVAKVKKERTQIKKTKVAKKTTSTATTTLKKRPVAGAPATSVR